MKRIACITATTVALAGTATAQAAPVLTKHRAQLEASRYVVKGQHGKLIRMDACPRVRNSTRLRRCRVLFTWEGVPCRETIAVGIIKVGKHYFTRSRTIGRISC